MKKNGSNRKLFLVLFAAYVVFVFANQEVQRYKLNNIVKENNEKIISQQSETEQLKKLRESYQSDEYIEKMAREKLGYVKPGEKVYIDRAYQK